jgi:signal transduction histidine kinase
MRDPASPTESAPLEPPRPDTPTSVLLVDDRPANLLALEATLEAEGLRLVRAGSGDEALRLALTEDFAVILLDVQMPGIDGLETARLLRTRPSVRNTPIIFVSANAPSQAELVRGYSSGAVDYLFKPFEPAILRAKVAVFVELYRQREAIRWQAERLREQRLAREQAELRLGREARARSLAEEESRTVEALWQRAEEARAEASEARARAEEANRAKDEFLATTSHELRTPLNAILGWARMLREGDVPPEHHQKGLEVIERNARVQVKLIEDLLDASRIVTGKLRLQSANVDVRALVEAAIETVRPAAEARGVALVPRLDEGLGVVVGDGDRLQQVAWNLLSNAVKFTERGRAVRVHAGREEAGVVLQVRDEGAGIAPEFLPHVFEPFRQADASSSRSRGGLGLGLAIVKSLVELHGGTICAESEGLGKGSTFRVTLPIRAVALSAEEQPTDAPNPLAPVTMPPPSSLGDLRVLLVDDESDARELVATVLERAGAIVRVAGSAGEAADLLEAEVPDVLVSDVGLPGEDGYELARKLRSSSDETMRRVPALALTAYARSEDRQKALEAGFDEHTPKPVDPAALVSAVARVAGRLDARPARARGLAPAQAAPCSARMSASSTASCPLGSTFR